MERNDSFIKHFKMNLTYSLAETKTFEYPLLKYALWQIWLKFAQRFWRTRLSFLNVFSPFGYYLPLKKKAWPVIGTKLNYHHPTMLCTKFGWYWHSGSEEDFKNLSNCFRNILIISLWKIINFFNLTSPSSKRALC